MKPTLSNPTLVRTKLPASHTEAYRKREKERERMYREMMRVRPSSGLVGLITNRWKEALFQEVLRELAPEKWFPKEIRALLKSASETDPKVSAFIRVLFAQSENAWLERARAERPHPLGLTEDELKIVLEQAERLKSPRLLSRRGKIDPDYECWRLTPHKVPELAAALGLTPEGLKKKCTRLGIKLTPNPIRRRAATICPIDAISLFELQLKRSINQDNDVRDRLRRKLELRKLGATSTRAPTSTIITPAGSHIESVPAAGKVSTFKGPLA
jgi:hypothetical protein